ncbi:hypothetical protein BRC77_11180 [Halobacteriales archaeon QH_8_64_26]|nr:MAG: hypothetical protein BRC77_11180 [Halobacteriales archaeon QH_8_64_26]
MVPVRRGLTRRRCPRSARVRTRPAESGRDRVSRDRETEADRNVIEHQRTVAGEADRKEDAGGSNPSPHRPGRPAGDLTVDSFGGIELQGKDADGDHDDGDD